MATSFLQKLGRHFTSTTLRRGQDYAAAGRVEVHHADEGDVEATVRGTDRYSVQIYRQSSALCYACDCPVFGRDGTPCKHLWAVLLTLDRRGELVLLEGGEAPTLVPMDSYEDLGSVEDLDFEDFEDFDDFEDLELGDPAPRSRPPASSRGPLGSPRPSRRGSTRPPKPGTWRDLVALGQGAAGPAVIRPSAWEARQLLYVLDLPATLRSPGLVLDVLFQERGKDGTWGKPRPAKLSSLEIPTLPDPRDREIQALLQGAAQVSRAWYDLEYPVTLAGPYVLPHGLRDALLPRLAESGRLRLREGPRPGFLPEPVELDSGPAWRLSVRAEPGERPRGLRLTAHLQRGEERLALPAVEVLLAGGWLVNARRLARLDDGGLFPWIVAFRRQPEYFVPQKEVDQWLAATLARPGAPVPELPPELAVEEEVGSPAPRLAIRGPTAGGGGARALPAALAFGYGDQEIAEGSSETGIFYTGARRVVRRDPAAEAAAADLLRELGLRPRAAAGEGGPRWELPPAELPRVVRELVGRGWLVEAEGRRYRTAGGFRMGVSSGVDWFDLEAAAAFGDREVPLPALLRARERGEPAVLLDDGTLGLLPEEWLARHDLLGGLGRPEGDRLRFHRAQLGMLDALLAGEAELDADAAFRRAREELASFTGIEPADAPAGFQGTLRPYQREGLGWLGFLERFGWGGCLADDMGLGKTVQVLALLQRRRRSRRRKGLPPSLVVAPRSVVFNWLDEAARFTPRLEVLDFTGPGRPRSLEELGDPDLVLTTYGTLRRDAALLARAEFDLVVLDEAQAIKNARTQAARAARALSGRQRLALSGTPIENHLGELWSLFEFLNPGMLGGESVFGRLRAAGAGGQRELLARALRPFILRRTKEQVLSDLPAKTEQTLHCELGPRQRRHYAELQRYYQARLKKALDERGLARSKIQVLEALLRLRQAACHPGLVDPRKAGDGSAKLDALLPLLAEVLDGGHKALVFSQFTSFLAHLRRELDARGLPYCYLDGRTRDRKARVERFQNDPGVGLFLISLKAGGLGLNLTAADYVFLLDPWWNPAVEAQAIDRSHRLGQTRRVFAYRLVASDTIEEKILALQESKKELAESILKADQGLLKTLTREELLELVG